MRGGREFNFVYFVQAEALGLVKIGATACAATRFRSMHTDSPDKLSLLGVIRCDEARALEARLHVYFRKDRSHREWFRPSERLLRYIGRHATSIAAAKLLSLDDVVHGNRQRRARGAAALAIWEAEQAEAA
ncbi:MAG: GIY-YIG nuclease family protein [Pseudomonadota bacterium]